MYNKKLYNKIITLISKEIKKTLNEDYSQNEYDTISIEQGDNYIENKLDNTICKKFNVSGTVKQYYTYSNYEPISIDFDKICLYKHYYSSTYYYSVSFIKNDSYIISYNIMCRMAIDEFAEKFMNNKITINNKKSLKSLLNYYLDNQYDSYLRGKIIDTGIMEILKEPSVDSYSSKGTFKIDISTLKLFLKIKNVLKDTLNLRKKGQYGIGTIDNFLSSDIRKLGKLFNMDLPTYSEFEGNEGYNFMSEVGIYIDNNGNIIKSDDPYYGKSIQNKVYDIIEKCINTEIPSLDELYITNHQDTLIPGKIGRNYNMYIETSLTYLQHFIKNTRITSDDNWYSGKSYINCSFRKTKQNMDTLEKLIKVFNYKDSLYSIYKDSNTISIYFNIKELKNE